MNKILKIFLVIFGVSFSVILLLLSMLLAARLMLIFENEASASDIGVDTEAGLSSDEDARTNLLVMGRDEASGLYDMIMLVSYNTTRSEVGVVQIPRDTYAEFTDGSYKKLNGAVAALGGEKAFCAFLSRTLCVNIDHYISFDLYSVGEIVDSIGGVEVDLPFDMDYEDPAQGLSIHLKKGKNLLNGEEARKFVRYRSGYLEGDLGRIDAQKLFVAALVKKLKTDLSMIEVASVIAAVSDDVKMNIPVSSLVALIRQAMSIPIEGVKFVTLAGESAVADKSGASYYVISRPSAIEIVSELLGAKASEERFDKDREFLNERYDSFKSIYESPAEYKIYDARSLAESGIDIVHK